MDHTFMLNPPTVSAYSEWMMLRALFEFGGLSRFCGHRHGWFSDEIASALGLPSEVEQVDEMPKMVKALLGERYRLLKQSARSDSERVLLEQNIAALAERLQLNRVEMLILRLAVYMQIDPTLKEALNRPPPFLPSVGRDAESAVCRDSCRFTRQTKTDALWAVANQPARS